MYQPKKLKLKNKAVVAECRSKSATCRKVLAGRIGRKREGRIEPKNQ